MGGEPQMKGSQIFYYGHLACLNSAPESDLILIILHSNSALALEKTLSFFQGCSLYKHLERQSQYLCF